MSASRPTDLESVTWCAPRGESFLQVWRWYDHPLPTYAHMWPCDLWPFDFGQWSDMAGHVVNPSTKFEDPMAILELWVLTSHIGYQWQCICSHCACAVSCDLCVGCKFFRYISNPWPWFAYSHYTTFMALRLRQMELTTKTMYGPVLKITQLSAHAQNHVSTERCRKSFTTIVLGDHDFPLIASNFGNLAAFRAIFSHIFTAHAQKWLFMNFQLKFWHHRSIPWPWFPYRARYFHDLSTLPVDFCIG